MANDFNNWLENREKINNHNNPFELELNFFADINHSLYKDKQGYNSKMFKSKNKLNSLCLPKDPTLPPHFDWREMGVVTPVKNQGQCGSCWAFSAVASMEGQHAMKTSKLLSLSESQIVNCDSTDEGCLGGWPDGAFEYAIKNGMELEKDFPYQPIDGNCTYNKSKVAARFSNFTDVIGGEYALQKAVVEIGPISVAIDASGFNFQYYKEGVYYDKQCSSQMLDHAVLVVGYGTTSNGTDYWIVKNSWGENWGNKGYIWMSRNRGNNCGIASKPSYPIN